MLPDIYLAKYMHEEYESRLKAEQLVRIALKARAEHTDPTAYSVGQGYYRWVAGLLTTLWRWGRRTIRRWSGQDDAMLSFPINHKF